MLNAAERAQIAALVERYALDDVLDVLGEICAERAQNADGRAAQRWRDAEDAVRTAAKQAFVILG